MAKKRANVSASFSVDAKKIFDTLPPGTRTGVLEKLVLICVPIIRNEGTPAVLTDVEAMRSLLSRELGGVPASAQTKAPAGSGTKKRSDLEGIW